MTEQIDKHEYVTEFDAKSNTQLIVACKEQEQKIDITNSETKHIESAERNKKEAEGRGNTTKEVSLPPSITESLHQTETLIAQASALHQTDEDKENANEEETDSTEAKEILIDVTEDCLSYENNDANLYVSESKNLAHINSIGTEASNVFT